MRDELGRLTPHDRLLLRLRFVTGMPPRQITHLLGVEAPVLYRRINHSVARLRRALVKAGLEARDVREALGLHGLDLGATLDAADDASPSIAIGGPSDRATSA